MRFRRVTHTLRSATTLAAPRPAYAAGVRGAIATIVPLALAEMFGSAAAGTWASLGGFNAALSDRGGDYRTRARTMLAILATSGIAAALGTLAAGHLVAALATTFVVAFLASLFRAWGNPGISIGGGALTSYVVALAIPAARPMDALFRAAFIAAGSLWAMAIALVVWPLRPFRPARVAVADCYRVLASYVEQVADDAQRRHTAEWPVQHTPTTISNVRTALETSRAVLVQMRRGRPGAMARGERLLVLNESADQIFGHVVALTDVLATLRDTAGDGYAAAVAALSAIAATARQLAKAVEDEEHQDAITITWNGEGIRRTQRAKGEDGDAAQQEQAAIILDRAAQFAASAAETVSALNTGRAGEPLAAGTGTDIQVLDASEPALWDTFRAALSPDSLLARFALRVAVVTTIAVGLTEYFAIPRGYWVTITVIVILQPYTGVTLTRAIQRVAGTVLGGLLAAALGAAIHDERGILVIATVFVACCIALMPVNYAAYSIFLTPTFVLLAEASAGDWHLASTRVVNTLLGGGLALLGARVLWPSPERSRFPAVGAEALRKNAEYLSSVIARYDDRSDEASNAIRAARRAVGIATVNAEESLQRSLAEVHGDERRIAPALTLLAYTRRFTATVAALSVARFASGAAMAGNSFAELADLFARTFADLAAAVEEGRSPQPLPRFGTPELRADLSPHVRARFERLLRQTRTMHDAVLRMAPPASPAVAPVVQSR